MTTTALLTVSGLRVRYGDTVAVDGVDLTVGRGEVLALVGESGSGKSTTAHAILGLLGSSRIDGGAITFDGLRLDTLGERAFDAIRGTRIGFVPQDPATSLDPVMRVGDQVAEVLRIHRLAGRRGARSWAVELLGRAGLDDPVLRARQYPHEMSGGQRQRVAIAVALAASPDLLIADEPTSALDVTVQKRILDDLDRRRAESGTAVLLVTHDLGVAADRADRIAVMHRGRIVETGTPAEILGAPAHAYTADLVSAAPSLSSHAPPRAPVPADRPLLLELRGVGRRFRVDRSRSIDAVRSVSLAVRKGSTTAIVGESGSGKTTTARIAARLERPSHGVVLWEGEDITAVRGRTLRELRRRIQVVHQNPYASLDPAWRIADIVAEPLRAFGIGDRPRRVAELLDRVALPESYGRRRPAELSGGQRQRVAIARALALAPDLVVLDEPVSALDVSVQARILDLLAELQRDLDLTYVFISHDLAVVRQISDEVVVMREGRVVEEGPAARLFDDPCDPYTRELLAAVPGPRQEEQHAR
ncbi:ABC transporter ATP-binding protein [Rhodococcus rhodnii]|uniref:ABC peptide transporter n=2 Tax=Rhodococcus rhodnii TaxID=38312 RepID=R7WRP2_9NOCA|nr:ABC transporter ATP-binding protein [Rhodococcus rhodnii]EOM78002.1 ABC peptide transporter [Rhodococcus rhodnii LMG 5362]TXG92063.1 ABC transporter ATP-binding protein [Rhodococcus rhodnii]